MSLLLRLLRECDIVVCGDLSPQISSEKDLIKPSNDNLGARANNATAQLRGPLVAWDCYSLNASRHSRTRRKACTLMSGVVVSLLS